jgi:hypothetical protein
MARELPLPGGVFVQMEDEIEHTRVIERRSPVQRR